jgi:hypothetical protein
MGCTVGEREGKKRSQIPFPRLFVSDVYKISYLSVFRKKGISYTVCTRPAQPSSTVYTSKPPFRQQEENKQIPGVALQQIRPDLVI